MESSMMKSSQSIETFSNISAVYLRLFIENMGLYEEGIVEIIRQYLVGIGLTENRAYFSHKYINTHYNIYLLKNKLKEVSCTIIVKEDIVDKPSNPYYNNTKSLLNIKDVQYYESFDNRGNVYYCGVVSKLVRIVRLTEWEQFAIRAFKNL